MINPIPNEHPLRKWFSGLVEQSFQTRVGLCEPSLLDYLSALLTEYIHVERINSLADGSGRRIEDVADLLYTVEAQHDAQRDERLRQVHRQIGDFTLFWTGVYPENLRRIRRRPDRADLLSYFEQGKRSYAIASHLSDDRAQPPRRLLEILSDEFEACAYGLGLVRQEWEHSGSGILPISDGPK